MAYEVWNFGKTLDIPWKAGKCVTLVQGTGFTTENKEGEEIAEYMRDHCPMVEVKVVGNGGKLQNSVPEEHDLAKEPGDKVVDPLPKHMGTLRAIAKRRGIKTWVGIKKRELLELLKRGV